MKEILKIVLLINCVHLQTLRIASDESPNSIFKGLKKDNPVILITGMAGFIGFSVAKKLQTMPEVRRATIIGVDTFNSYYDPQLKRDRALYLQQFPTIRLYEGDVCNATLMGTLFKVYHFTHVLHLAAQAGVRYSLKRPQEYIRNNIETIVKDKQRVDYPHFIYASSSSVYGFAKKKPFQETEEVQNPASIYAASKVMNEMLVRTYFHLYGLKSIGLRFFTVYGPWGRPDMAAFEFTKRIGANQVVTVFNNGTMERDFTFIADIVDGIIRAMNCSFTSPEVFNLGNGKPIPVMEFIRVIEKLLSKKAHIRYADAKTEVPVTYADIHKAYKLLGYRSTTSVEEGMAQYISWYITYYKNQ